MAKLSRVGDRNNAGGAIVRGARTVYATGKNVGLHVSTITPHAPWGRRSHRPHRAARTTEGSPDVYCEGLPVLRVGSGNSCGHSIAEGSDTVDVT